MSGLVDMPSALSFGDGVLGLTTSHFVKQTRHTLAFQITLRLTGSFRYSLLHDVSPGADGNVVDFRFDRSFSVQFRLADEGRYTPAVAIGLNDLLGTGQFGAEHIVATRTVTPDLRVTGGIGWGRFTGVGGFDNPLGLIDERFEERAGRNDSGFGGEIQYQRWFTGPAAVFGGVEWRATDDLTLIAEYSPDAYPVESPFVFDRRSQVNVGLRYRLTDDWTLAAQYLYGSELGVQPSWAIDPRDPPGGTTGIEPTAPLVRTGAAANVDPLSAARWALRGQDLVLHGLTITGTAARIEVENPTYPAAAQAIGRAARTLTGALPSGVERFAIVLIEDGMPVSEMVLTRADLESLEFAHDGAWQSFTRALRADAGPGTEPLPGLFPRFDWDAEPFIAPTLFDPDSPFRADAGLDFSGRFDIAPGLSVNGLIRVPIIGNLDEADRPSTSILPRVRSDAYLYDRADVAITRLTADWAFRPADDVYARVQAGYLEPMFGGVAAEVLWYPHDSRWAFGADVAQVRQRDFDQRFGFQDYEVTTGHLSAYWDIGGGYQAQVDSGRYLAGDWGATLTLERRFENGWRVGAFATLTDVPFDDFGEGAFDKGITLTIPIGWVTGEPTRDTSSLTIRPVLRDGGARLNLDGRLYDTVRPANGAELADSWGRFWR